MEDLSTPVPKHERVRELLRQRIVEGEIPVGSQLPPEPALANQFELNRLTLRKSVDGLIAMGLLKRIHGKGTFVISREPLAVLKKHWNIGLAFYDITYATGPCFAEVVAGIYNEVNAANASLQLLATDVPATAHDSHPFATKIIKGKRLDGVIIMDQVVSERDILALKKARLPVVLIDRTINTGNVSFVRTDNARGIQQIFKHLFELNHRRIAFLYDGSFMTSTQEKIEGYQQAVQECGLPYDEALVANMDSKKNHLPCYIEQLELWKKLALPPTAVITTGDTLAYKMGEACRKMKIRIPEDLSLSGYNDISQNESIEPPLTSIRVPFREMGRLAAKMVIDVLERRKIQNHVLAPQLIVRSSCDLVGGRSGLKRNDDLKH